MVSIMSGAQVTVENFERELMQCTTNHCTTTAPYTHIHSERERGREGWTHTHRKSKRERWGGKDRHTQRQKGGGRDSHIKLSS